MAELSFSLSLLYLSISPLVFISVAVFPRCDALCRRVINAALCCPIHMYISFASAVVESENLMLRPLQFAIDVALCVQGRDGAVADEARAVQRGNNVVQFGHHMKTLAKKCSVWSMNKRSHTESAQLSELCLQSLVR